jgi:hypothetical protein
MSDVCNRCKQPLVDGRCPNATPETIEDERDALRARVAELEQERDNWHASFIAEYESASVELIRDSLALAESQRDAALADLVRYKEAAAAQLHYDMKSVVDGTPEQRLRKERDEAIERLAFAEGQRNLLHSELETIRWLATKALGDPMFAIDASTNPDKAGK